MPSSLRQNVSINLAQQKISREIVKIFGKVFSKGSETNTHNGQYYTLHDIKHM